MNGRIAPAFVLGLAFSACSDNGGPLEPSPDEPGAAFVMTNAPAANEVWMFERAVDGSLSFLEAFPTGGLGTGTGLGNQGGVVLSGHLRWLLVVNPGSDDLSVFAVGPQGLTLTDRVPSGGARPISVTVHGPLVYVLNAGGDGNISGFTLNGQGRLTPLPGSTRSLSGAEVDPAQVEFTPDGSVLVVTEKASHRITTYTLGVSGLPSAPNPQVSAGQTPFGFGFDSRGHLIVSEAFGGTPDVSAVSSYRIDGSGVLQVISPSVGTTETAACWIVVTADGQFTYTTNAGSGSVSGYRIGAGGELTLLDADGRTGVTGPGTLPLDAALSTGSRYLYTLNGGDGTIGAFEIGSDRSLTPIDGAGGLPAGANGLAAW